MMKPLLLACSSVVLLLASGCDAQPPARHGLEHDATVTTYDPSDSTIALRFDPPADFVRDEAAPRSFAAFLRALPLERVGTGVHLYNGRSKARQDVHAAVLDVSVGSKDLQQCADAVMRLRAEHLYASGQQDAIAFRFTSGFLAEWKRWRQGERISVSGNSCSWKKSATPDASHAQLLNYLEMVFTYAGTLSLQRELVPTTGTMEIGDVFIQGGSPGHAVIVVDVARHADGRTAFLIAQSYMPAQQIHVLKNLHHTEFGAWFILDSDAELLTPEWTFAWSDRRRWPH